MSMNKNPFTNSIIKAHRTYSKFYRQYTW